MRPFSVAWAVLVCLLCSVPEDLAQAPPPPSPAPATKAPPIERIGADLYRIDRTRVDLEQRRVTIPGVVNSTTVLEYLANARRGFKAYESALELDTTATNFNLALIMIGLGEVDPVPSKYKFEPEAPRGDPVRIWVEWSVSGKTKRVRAEDLIYDAKQQRTLEHGPWVYTGSVFMADGTYLAEADGVLIGFMHTPESVVDSSLKLQSEYGGHQLNPSLRLSPGTPVTVIVEASGPESGE